MIGTQPGYTISDADLRAALDNVVLTALRPVAIGLGALFTIFAVSHALILPEEIAALMSAVAASTAIMLFGLAVGLKGWSVSARWAHPLGMFISGLVLLNSFLHLALTSEPFQTTNLMLLIVGVGLFFLSTRWLIVVIVATTIGWALVAWTSAPSPDWLHFGFALLTSIVLSVLIHTVRMRAMRRLEGLRLHNRFQNAELEAALHVVSLSESRLEKVVAERTLELHQAHAQILEQQRLQQEVELAAQIQASLSPDHVPALASFESSAIALPARYVSGDLYDLIFETPETGFVIMADISGKGVPAALLASQARALVRAETNCSESPASILYNVNRLFYHDLAQAEAFITLIVARLDTRSGLLTYASAGHSEAMWWQCTNHTCRRLAATGMPVGISEHLVIEEESLALRPGDVLVFYSDGVTETENAHGELFGVDRLADLVSANAHLRPYELSHTIVEQVQRFSHAPRWDDLTLVVLKALSRTLDLAYPANMEGLGAITSLVRRSVQPYGDDFAYQVELAVSEIVTNIIRHAYSGLSGAVRGAISLLPDRVELDLYDDGLSFDLASLPPPVLGELREGGYGLLIAGSVVDQLDYVPRSPGGNHWHMVKMWKGSRKDELGVD